MKFLRIFTSLPGQLALIVLFSALFGHLLPLQIQAFFFSVSLTMKEGLLTFLPIMIFSFVFASFSEFKQGVVSFVLLLLITVCISNFIAVLVSYGVGASLLPWLPKAMLDLSSPQAGVLEPLWTAHFIRILSNEKALLLGLIMGVIASRHPHHALRDIAELCRSKVVWFLEKAFLPVVPIFILGFMLKLAHDGALVTLLKSFSSLFVLILLLQALYVLFIFGFAAGFNPKIWIRSVQAAFPAFLMGFSSMSSAAALPALMRMADQETSHPEVARAVAPSVINIHMLGDGLAIPLMAMLILYSTTSFIPSMESYLGFALGYVVAKFAAAGVPGGTILVMIPVLETHLGFTGEMSALILMMYVLFDPFCTAFNVLGNGGFIMLFTKLWSSLGRLLPKQRSITVE